jgi:hypothetical protein
METKFWSEYLKEGDHLEEPDIDGRNNIELDLKGIRYEYVDWVHLAGTRGRLL